MANPLQKSPLGLLGALALKTLGRNPDQFSSSVMPTMDVYDQYLATSELQMVVDTTNLTLTGETTKTFTVPTGKVWRLIAAGGRTGLNAADVALIMAGVVNLQSPNGAPQRTPIGVFLTPQLGQGLRAFGFNFRPPIFLPSGWKVLVDFDFSAAVTVAVPGIASIVVQEFDL